MFAFLVYLFIWPKYISYDFFGYEWLLPIIIASKTWNVFYDKFLRRNVTNFLNKNEEETQ